ncbi:hypothetical protein M2480_002461 [Parabacteroides sp. PFB2-12]|uniref:RagB/SusD family nutrient uptake outer membrane protein n=1 Tax=unclassified Parabacteroides TaxID=2649774 RepID=UPI00247608DD|nr:MULTISPECIES: RagB/SusD family nutrient uptake outer membrane protein [unclassified Parabacteroides]MDH6342766.1 hypothetical protein [Parabacteroides sp. PM6-13]MDH6391466.1 hypothetical protein [Parabacteroides sp. PFB2-12]
MKTKIVNKIVLIIALCGVFVSCEDFLDREPLSNVAPEQFFADASQVQAYVNDIYPRILPASSGNSYGFYANDAGTDNQVGLTPASRYTSTDLKVSQSGGDWSFGNIYRINFFFPYALARFGSNMDGSENTINGQVSSIKHYIGEMYFLRALEYFKRYQKFGDFPIITEPLTDDFDQLVEQSKRMPRNEVARFILNDLDSAALFMSDVDLATVRINRDVALLLKSRVALFEATWLKYFKGTAFVPNGEGWPGKSKDYNANYQFPSGNIDNEINYFLDIAMSASKEVAEKYKNKLTTNTGILQQEATAPANPYYDMFASEDLSGYAEVLLWRDYAKDVLGNDIALAANQSNWGVGVTRAYVQNFLMEDGTPVYAHGSYMEGDGYYKGDQTVADVVVNRDSRLSLFLKVGGQKNILVESQTGLNINFEEPNPEITIGYDQRRYTTGYALRKGGAFDSKYYIQNKGYIAFPVYRAVEALLNYMEASYEKEGALNATAREYWQIIRRRANVSDDIDKTIAATVMSKEAENDWGAYSGGNILSDATLYNIRRERRSEYLSEGIRYMDLCRWRSMDQMLTKPYIPEGMHLWNTPMEGWYDDLLADGSDKANVSPKEKSEYIRPYQRTVTQRCYNGFEWKMAHYLDPIKADEFLITSPDGTSPEQSPLYQNPYWPMRANETAEK